MNTEELNKPLDPKVVKQRSMSGRQMSYVEAWYVIDRLNQVFGFDGWTRETLEMNLVQQEEKENSNGKVLHYVGYVAQVRVCATNPGGHLVGGTGTGFGQGQDADLGRAHESAVKEAESDAMKRAAMTFGYQFGLALYDKTQEHVAAPVAKEQDITQSPVAKAAHYMKTELGISGPDAKAIWKAALKDEGTPENACGGIVRFSTAEELQNTYAPVLEGKELHKASMEVVEGGKK